jgi:hypothetical protein
MGGGVPGGGGVLHAGRKRMKLLNKWPEVNEETALRKLLTGNKATEIMRNLNIHANKTKYKSRNPVEKERPDVKK